MLTGGALKSTATRTALAVLATVPLGALMIYAGLLAGLALIEQVLGGLIDLSEATWTSFLNPAVILGWQSPGGTGGPLDAIVGGPGAPGGTVPRYLVFMVSGAIAYASYFGLRAVWHWAKTGPRPGGNADPGQSAA
jgi:hypothetical protein